MKRKEIEAFIKQKALAEMPEVIDRINLDRITIEPKKRKVFNFNFGNFVKFASGMIALVVTGFIAYNALFSDNSNPVLSTDTEVLGFQTITAAVLLDDANLVELSYSAPLEITELQMTTQEVMSIEDYVGDINPYMHLMETIINDNDSVKYEEFVSDDENYTYAFSYTSTDLSKNPVTYKVYYNLNEEMASGKIKFGEKEFSFEAKKALTTVRIDSENYITVSDESTTTLQKFNYRLYQNGLKMSENNLEIYKVNNNIRVRTKVMKNGLSLNLDVKREFFNELDEFEVTYEIENQTNMINGNFRINLEFDSEENGYVYRYTFGNNNGGMNQPRGPFMGPRA
ncbi:MAG: hypothetical protein RBR96_04835 [Candidatus Izemoplasmatales bacterium]|jgi:hypothetical protein|nr:hypothetical protein [Candidatus Izemoplasmatales bacterium]